MDSITGKAVTFRIEVEDKPLSILLVFDRKTEMALLSWQDAFQLAQTMEQVISDLGEAGDFAATYPGMSQFVVIHEQAQIKLNHQKGLVALLVESTDRLRFTSLEAFALVARALKQTAQDAHLEQEKGIVLDYIKDGISLRRITNRRNGITQIVR